MRCSLPAITEGAVAGHVCFTPEPIFGPAQFALVLENHTTQPTPLSQWPLGRSNSANSSGHQVLCVLSDRSYGEDEDACSDEAGNQITDPTGERDTE